MFPCLREYNSSCKYSTLVLFPCENRYFNSCHISKAELHIITLCVISGLNVLIIQESTVLVFLSHAIRNESPRAGCRIDPLTKPILFLASRAMIMLRDQV